MILDLVQTCAPASDVCPSGDSITELSFEVEDGEIGLYNDRGKMLTEREFNPFVS